jgi:hypothetical protein
MSSELWKPALKTWPQPVNNVQLDTTALTKESGKLLITSALLALTLLLVQLLASLAKLVELVERPVQLKLYTRALQEIVLGKCVNQLSTLTELTNSPDTPLQTALSGTIAQQEVSSLFHALLEHMDLRLTNPCPVNALQLLLENTQTSQELPSQS